MKCGTFFEGTARLFINVSMVFSLHLITRSQKSTKMDEFELSGCTKLRYLHDWCCLALLSFLLFGCFVLILLFVVCFVTFALFTSFSKVFLDLFSFLYCSLRVFFFGRSSLIGTHTPHGLRCLNFCTALCLHNEDDIYSVNECGCFVCWFVYLFWLLLLLLLCICMWVLSTVGEKPKTEKPIEWLFCFPFEACDSECLIVVVNI